MKMYSVYDIVSAGYSRPFPHVADGSAVRDFSDAVNDPQGVLGKHPEHYDLRRIGDWDEATGKLTGCDPVILITAASVKIAPHSEVVALESKGVN